MKISYQLTPDDYIRATRLHMRPRAAFRYIGYLILILFTLFITWQAYDVIFCNGPQKNFWLLLGFAAYLFLIFFVVQPRNLKRIFSQQKSLHSPHDLEFTESHFIGSSSRGTFKMPWSDFHKWKKNDNYILVYQSSIIMHVIPIRTFQSPSDMSSLISILEANLGPQKV